ncbi:hypothetical protein ACQJBY_069202 [Aegilops geniculata]
MGGGDRPIVPDAKSPSSTTSSSTEAESRHKSSSKNSHGKKKAKVDWTPELHRRFVQAVEQLGIDKAVPSRILEIMGINSLTRHNIASHLQGPAAYMPTHGTPCMAMPMTPKFPAPPVPVAMPCPVYAPPSPAPALSSKSQQDSQLQLQAQPSNESIDAAIGDVLSKPWLPLPLGLKPPSLGSVMGELERQGVANVPQAYG